VAGTGKAKGKHSHAVFRTSVVPVPARFLDADADDECQCRIRSETKRKRRRAMSEPRGTAQWRRESTLNRICNIYRMPARGCGAALTSYLCGEEKTQSLLHAELAHSAWRIESRVPVACGYSVSYMSAAWHSADPIPQASGEQAGHAVQYSILGWLMCSTRQVELEKPLRVAPHVGQQLMRPRDS
jgi:hypothetical protein